MTPVTGAGPVTIHAAGTMASGRPDLPELHRRPGSARMQPTTTSGVGPEFAIASSVDERALNGGALLAVSPGRSYRPGLVVVRVVAPDWDQGGQDAAGGVMVTHAIGVLGQVEE
jgi:hypothetical protein